MNIDYTKLNKKHWFEDADGNVIPCEENEVGRDAVARTVPDNEAVYYHHCFPLELYKQIDEYCYHPEYSDEWKKCNTECDFCKK